MIQLYGIDVNVWMGTPMGKGYIQNYIISLREKVDKLESQLKKYKKQENRDDKIQTIFRPR